MERPDINKLYQMLIHNINGLKPLESPSFNIPNITKLIDEFTSNNNFLSEEYKTKYIQAIYENNVIYENFKSLKFTKDIEKENLFSECRRKMNDEIYNVEQNLYNKKIEGINKYKENENSYIPRVHFINSNKKENKEHYMKEISSINNKRIQENSYYHEIANDLSNKTEQKQFKFNHSIEASIEKNKKDKLELEQYLKEQIEFLETLLDTEVEKLKKDITDQELIIADKTIISNNAITKLSEDYKKRLQYGYIPYDIEQNKLLDKDAEEQKMYSMIEEQILNEFKTKLQENDNEIDSLRQERKQFETEFKVNLRQIKKEQNSNLRKKINEYNKEINAKTKIYNDSKTRKDKKIVKKLINEKHDVSVKMTRANNEIIAKLKQEFLEKELEYIKKFELLRTEKSKYETSKSNAMKNLNHERTFFQTNNSLEIKKILGEKDSFAATDKYNENIEILKLRLERDIEKANINKEISLITLNINSKKYQHKYLINKAIADKEYNEGLSNADLMYQTESNNIRKNHANVSNMLAIQKQAIIKKFNKDLHSEQMALETTKLDYYSACDNLQYQLYRNNYDYQTKIFDNEIEFAGKLAEITKQYLLIKNSLDLRMIKIENEFNDNISRVELYKNRFDVEKSMINDAYLTFVNSINNVIRFENFIHHNISSLTENEFDENKKTIIITLEYLRQIKLILLEEYYNHEITIINSRINFEKDLKFKKIIDNIKNEKKNFESQINNRKDKLQETISSYQNTIKLYENNISNKLLENEVIFENIKNSTKKEKKEYKNKIKGNNLYILNNKKQIKVNNQNIKELGKTRDHIEADINKKNKKYNKQIKEITLTLQNEAKVYTNNMTLITSQYYKLKSLINRSGYYTSRNKYNYSNASKNSNKVINMNTHFNNKVKNYYDIHYQQFVNSISKEFQILQNSYINAFNASKKEIDRALNEENAIYNTKIKSATNSNNAILNGLYKTNISLKKEIFNRTQKVANEYLSKIKDHNETIQKIENELKYELSCHNENIDSYEVDYKKALKDLTHKYSNKVEFITKEFHQKIQNLENDKKIHDKNIATQNISLETIRKNTINDLNNEFQATVAKTNNKIKLIKDVDKEISLKEEKTKKKNLKKFINEQNEIRSDFDKMYHEIEIKCNNRIIALQKDYIKKFKNQK